MRLYFRLLRVQFAQRLKGLLRSGGEASKRKAITAALIYLVALLSVAMLVGMYGWMLYAMLPSFLALGMDAVFLGVVMLATMVFVLFMGFIYQIGILYFAKDAEFLSALPIPQRTVFAAKFTQALLGELLTCALLLLPPLILYGVQTGAGVGYWLRALCVLLLTPCIPMAISGLLSTVLMRFTALWRRRELLTVIGSIALILLVILGQGYLTARLPEDITEEMISSLISDESALLKSAASAFPPSAWAAEGTLGNTSSFLLFALVSLASLAVLVLVAGRLYYRGVMAQTETAASHKAVRFHGRAMRRHGPVLATFLREWRIVLRTPVYALNGLVVILMAPLLMIFPMFFQSAPSGDAGLSEMIAQLQALVDPALISLILAGVLALISSLDTAVSTTISREGKLYYILRTIPVSPWKQILGKYLFGHSVSLLAMTLMGAVSALTLRLSIATILSAWLLGNLVAVAPIALSMIPDVLKPKLSWNSETEAIKQNMTGMLGMLLSWVYIAAMAFGIYQVFRLGLNAEAVWLIAAGASICLGALMLWVLSRCMGRTLRTIEG